MRRACTCSDDISNILFSSGTTGDPKAIPWSHVTPIRCGSDAFAHHDIRERDVVCWPTNLGWMMGPWLLYAALLNGAAVALFHGSPTDRLFPKFVEQARVTMLGLVRRRPAPLLPPQVDDAIGEMLALQYEELLDSQAVLERRLQATVDGMADGQRQAAALVAEAAAKAEELALAQEILRVRQDWREPRGVIRPARSR